MTCPNCSPPWTSPTPPRSATSPTSSSPPPSPTTTSMPSGPPSPPHCSSPDDEKVLLDAMWVAYREGNRAAAGTYITRIVEVHDGDDDMDLPMSAAENHQPRPPANPRASLMSLYEPGAGQTPAWSSPSGKQGPTGSPPRSSALFSALPPVRGAAGRPRAPVGSFPPRGMEG